MGTVLFDMRNAAAGFVANINEVLAKCLPEYVERYGAVCSDKWWRLYDEGRISRTIIAGVITHLGPARDTFGQEHDIVRLQTDRHDLEYDREGFWCDSRVQLGAGVTIEKVKIVVPSSTGPETSIVDIRVTLQDCQHCSLPS